MTTPASPVTTMPISLSDRREFMLAFDRKAEACECVLLGVVPIGQIEKNGHGHWQWMLYLPVVERMRRPCSLEEARGRVCDVVRGWLEAASVAAPADVVRRAAR